MAGLLAALNAAAYAAPFARQIQFRQPDGTAIQLWGRGDEFSADFETLDGYTVVFDPATRAYQYATLTPDGSALVPAGMQVGQGDPATLGLGTHLRLAADIVAQQRRARYEEWDRQMGVSARWEAMKQAQQAASTAGGASAAVLIGPPAPSATTGTKQGLTLLIDFDDVPATVAQGDLEKLCNADNYTGFGNNGSVKQFYYDNSNGLLTYTQVVTAYIRIPNSLHNRAYYDDTTKDSGTQAGLLITDAINIMKALPNYNSDILPTFSGLTVDGSNNVVASNVFFAGDDSGVFAKGLWPNSTSLGSAVELSPGGMKVSRFQISNIGDSPSLSPMCHENGHMLCGFPDLYEGSGDPGGSGDFSLMSLGTLFSKNPTQIDAYLKRVAGWATTTELTSSDYLPASVTATAGPDFNHFYRYEKSGTPTEYFIVENRKTSGHDANIPGAGVLVWHVDEKGDRNKPNVIPNTTHNNYELTLVQADNRWDMQNKANNGDGTDPYFCNNSASGYTNALSDSTAPNAHWFDDTDSGLNFHDFSCRADTMTFRLNSCTVTCPTTVTVANDAGQCGATVSYAAPTTSGSCGAVHCVAASGTFFTVGTTAVTCTSDEGNGCSFNVVVNDTEAPSITCPANVTAPNDPGLCSAVVTYPAPAVSDNCPAIGAPACAPPSGSVFGKGTTPVSCSVTDASGNGASCGLSVTVNDVEPPKVACSAQDVLLWPPYHDLLDVGFSASAVDNCPGPLPISVSVWSDEDDQSDFAGSLFSPDAKGLGVGTLRLRAERNALGDGRVYLDLAGTVDTSGNPGWACCTNKVPFAITIASLVSDEQQAVAAKNYCTANDAPPPGFFTIGDGPTVGPKQ
jgi:M6 family metalloprotease-like protein